MKKIFDFGAIPVYTNPLVPPGTVVLIRDLDNQIIRLFTTPAPKAAPGARNVFRDCPEVPTPGPLFKAMYLIARYEAMHVPEISAPAAWRTTSDPSTLMLSKTSTDVLICVLENGQVGDVALVMVRKEDFDDAVFDNRPRTWVLMDRATVRELVDEQYKGQL